MSIVVDLIFVVFAFFVILHAAKKGFVASAFSFASSLLGTVLSWLFAGMLCETVYTRFVKEHLLSFLQNSVLPTAENQVDDDLSAIAASIPDPLLDLARQLGLWDGGTAMDLSSIVNVQQLESAFLGPIAVFLVKCVLFVLFSIILGIVFRLLASLLNRLVKHSFLRGANIALGALFGALQSALLVFVLALCLTAICIPSAETSFAAAVADSKICGLAVEILHSL